MSGLLGLISFSLGASLGAEAVRVLGGSAPSDVREGVKAAVRTWDMLADAAGAAQEEFAAFQAEARAQEARARARAGKRAQLRRLPVSRE